MVMGRLSQKYADWNRKWLFPKTSVIIQPGDIIEYIACENMNMS